jgi:hypothetical protein
LVYLQDFLDSSTKIDDFATYLNTLRALGSFAGDVAKRIQNIKKVTLLSSRCRYLLLNSLRASPGNPSHHRQQRGSINLPVSLVTTTKMTFLRVIQQSHVPDPRLR